MSPRTRGVNTIARRRLANQHLVSPSLSRAAEIVRALGAVQAQDYAGAKWALAQRATGLTDAEIERAFAAGEILRTHVLRPTWHFIVPGDARWMLALTAPRVVAAMAYHTRQLGLDAATFRKSHPALERALRDGRQLTRAELSAVLARAGVKAPTGAHIAQILMQAELDRVIISGARQGKHMTYALFDERVPAAPARDRDESLDDLTRRYFSTRGPASLHDFAWWSGLTIRDAQRGVDAAGSSLVRETYEGKAYWSAATDQTHGRWTRVAHLLPNYDECFVGFRDRSAFAGRVRPLRPKGRVDALMGHVVFLDGEIVGGWRRALGKRAELELQLMVDLSRSERTLVERAARRLGEFLGLPVHVNAKVRNRGG